MSTNFCSARRRTLSSSTVHFGVGHIPELNKWLKGTRQHEAGDAQPINGNVAHSKFDCGDFGLKVYGRVLDGSHSKLLASSTLVIIRVGVGVADTLIGRGKSS